jgi:hypothetical protein
LRRVAQTYLLEAEKSRAVLTNEAGAKQCMDKLNFTHYEI